MTRIVYFGNHDVGCGCLKKLIEHRLVPELAVVQPADPGECLTYESVEALAAGHNIETFAYTSSRKNELLQTLESLRPDLIISVAWRHIFSRDILAVPRLGAVNFHGSLLPRCRGAHPTNWAIISGEKETGVTAHFIDEGIDTGDIIIQEKIRIDPEDTAYSLRLKQDKVSEKLMGALISLIHTGHFPRTKQDDSNATCFKPRKPEGGLIRWDKMTGGQICDFVRALTRPYPGAFVCLNGKKVILWGAKARQAGNSAPPGTLVMLDNGRPVFSTLDGFVTLLDFECPHGDLNFVPGMCLDPIPEQSS